MKYSDFKHWISSLHSISLPVSYYNFWDGQSADEIWFTEFVKSHGFLERHPKAEFAFFSALGKIELFNVDKLMRPFSRNRKRIFFTGENVHYDVFRSYAQNMLDYQIDLALGFDYIEDERYIRFPIWLLEMFPASGRKEDIIQICDNLSHQKYDENRNRFCAMVSGNGTTLGSEHIQMRTEMVSRFNEISKVDCAGRLLRNTEELQNTFNDNKAEFLKLYKFFICPENTSVDGYVSEKVFHAIGSGCIPVYRGSLNNPEPDVLNHNAILFWEKDGNNEKLLRTVSELYDNPTLYKEFFEQPRLKDNAAEVVMDYFDSLEQKIENLFVR